MYAFDTIYTTYDGAEIPRFRTCRNIREQSQAYSIKNDIGFTIEMGETPFQEQNIGPINLETQNSLLLVTQDGKQLIAQQPTILYTLPRVDLSISTDGGASFGSDMPYVMNPLGLRKNKLLWWQLGISNDFVPQFKFWGLGRFVVAANGECNVRQ